MRKVGVLSLSVLLALSIFALDANGAREARNVDITITPDKEEAYLVDETATFDIEIKRRGRYARLKLEQIEAFFPDPATHVTLTQIDRGRYTYTTPEFTEPGDFTLSITVRTWGAVRSIQRLERVIEIFKSRIKYWEMIKERARRERTKELIDRIIAIYQRIIERIQITIDRISQRGIIGHNSCTIEVTGVMPVTKYIEQMEEVCQETEDMEAASWGLAPIMEDLVEKGPSAVPKLLETAKDRTVSDSVRAVIIGHVLGIIDDKRSVEPLIEILDDPTERETIRAEAADTLGMLKDERAVMPLIDAIFTSQPYLASRAIIALGRIGDPRAEEPLIAILNDPQAKDLWAVASGALSKTGGSQAIEPLIATLEQNVDTAAYALSRMGGDQAIEALIAKLEKRDSGSVDAAGALGLSGDPRAVEPLIAALEAEDELLIGYAAKALGKLGDMRAKEPLENALARTTDKGLRRDIAAALKELTGEEYSY